MLEAFALGHSERRDGQFAHCRFFLRFRTLRIARVDRLRMYRATCLGSGELGSLVFYLLAVPFARFLVAWQGKTREKTSADGGCGGNDGAFRYSDFACGYRSVFRQLREFFLSLRYLLCKRDRLLRYARTFQCGNIFSSLSLKI